MVTLAIYKDGSFKVIYEDDLSGSITVTGCQLPAFGPSLVANGEITVDTDSGGAIHGL